MAVTTTSTLSANLHVYYVRKLLMTAEPRLVLAPLGMSVNLPKGNGKQVKWLRYDKLASSTTPLTEGVNPAEVSLISSNVTKDVAQYGQFAKISDFLEFTAIDPVIESHMERFGRAAAETVEDLHVAEIDAEAAIQYPDSSDTTDDDVAQGDVLDHYDLIRATVSQKLDYIGPHESGSFIAVLNAASEFDIKSDSQAGAWLDINKRTSGEVGKILNGEFGRMYGIRLLVSDKMRAEDNAGSVTVRNTYVIGEEAFGNIKFAGSNAISMIAKNPGAQDTSNPLNMFSTVGYKLRGYGVKYLHENSKRVIQIRTASALDAAST
jgi:N4-gp56 family major capsid protein